MSNYFAKDYLNYWDDAVKKSIDGLPIAGDAVQQLYLKKAGIKKTHRILDVGCGSGRNYQVLADFSSQVFGIDVSYDYLNKAKHSPYVALIKAGLEDTKFPADYFDFLFVWAVFDLVEQTAALIEANRVLNIGGKILLTAKNVNYSMDDRPALVAERNAKLKKFPHRFTDANKLCAVLGDLGFEVIDLIKFPRRGDLGKNSCDASSTSFYEFILIAQKISIPAKGSVPDISQEFSNTALQMSSDNHFTDVLSFFESTCFKDEL
ncbi:class I SAM-dependent methyltransferase [Aliiglaciecola litoralis]|uniref:Methyltransferase type 11 domain-containing protein n=1 Tax=Aliiglaciecola litoralis TaxID=582857 RepID=A0ABN1LKI1_9ALTE